MISLSALLTKYTLGIMSNLGNNNNPAGIGGGGGGVGGGAGGAGGGGAANNGHVLGERANHINNAQNPAAEGSMERGSCLLRYASQNSLDESSQKHIQRPNGRERTVGQYHNEQHTARSFEAMNDMRKQNLLCDVTLVADEIEIPAHKMVLASCSPYFYAMFNSFEESRQGRITLQGVDHRALGLLIEYVYTSTVEVNEDNVQVLLTAANLLQLIDVREACCDYLQTQLDASNCLGIREFADMHGCVDLLNYAETYIEQHFNEVIQFEEFLNLSHEQVIGLIRNDRISVPSEEKVYECVITWIRYDPNLREQHTAFLMEHVRLPFLSKEYITQRVDKEPLLDGNIVCKNLIIEALTYHLLPNDTKSARTIPRKPVGMPKILLVIGGQAPKAIRSVECYDLREEKWYQAAEMPNRRCRAGLSVLGDKVYAVGGFNGSLRVRTVDVYDPTTDGWSTCNSMEARRSTLGVAVLNGCIYAVGGFDGTTGLCSAEVFDPKSEIWRFIAAMSTRRSSVGVGVVNGLLYAVGGYDGYSRQCLSSVERYNPDNDTWSGVADMSARRSGAGVGVLNNILYAVGGHDGPMVRKSVEAYDPEANQWHSVAEMSFCRRNAGVVAHDGQLFVVGGDDGTSNLASVEVYCPETDTWRILPAAMTIGRSYAGVCMIDKPMQAAASTNGFVADDENSQAEGTVEGAVGFARNEPAINNNNNAGVVQQQQQQQNHPHYENIYESIEQYNAAAAGGAVAPADDPQAEAIAQPPPARINNTNNNNSQPQPARLLASSINYRNDLYDRTNQANVAAAAAAANAYDVPLSVRSAFRFHRNLPYELQDGAAAGVNRFNSSRYGGTTASGNAASSAMFHGACPRQRSFDDTESQNYYNLNYPQPTATLRYDNIYEQIRDEPIYRNAPASVAGGSAGGVAGAAARVYGRLNVIGHGIGRIERHLSSSCGNIDHYNLGGHYAVLGHSHFGTVGHIRLNAAGANANGATASGAGAVGGGVAGTAAASATTTAAQRDANNVKNSASSFFSCLHGESSQSMSNIYRTTAANGGVPPPTNGVGTAPAPAAAVVARESRSASAGPLSSAAACALDASAQAAATTKHTGAIPKIKALSSAVKGGGSGTAASSAGNERGSIARKSQANATAVATSARAQTAAAHTSNSGSLNRISKSSLQWLLVNKWLPLWIGQGPDCKVIDFNFMFSRDCVGCDTSAEAAAAAAAAATSQMYGSPRLGGLPQDIVRFNARAEMHAAASLRRDHNIRPLHNALNRLREAEQPTSSRNNNNGARRYEDPSYENVHVQWQNGFEFGRSRDYEQHEHSAVYGLRPQLQRARSESPRDSRPQPRRLRTNSTTPQLKLQPGLAKYGDPFRNYELNAKNNTFRPKLPNVAPDAVDGGEQQTLPPAPVEADEQLEGAVGGLPPTVAVAVDVVDGGTARSQAVSMAETHENREEAGAAEGAVTTAALAAVAAANPLDNETETANTNATKYSTKTTNANCNRTNSEQTED